MTNKLDYSNQIFHSLGSMSDSDEERVPASSLRRAVEASRNADHPSSLSRRALVTRTVNGTGHTDPSEFCATSI